MTDVHPDLQRVAAFLPRFSFGPTTVRVLRCMEGLVEGIGLAGPGVEVTWMEVPASATGPAVRVRVLRPRGVVGPVPALLHVHGGGMMTGNPSQLDPMTGTFVRELGIVVVAVKYRRAPEHPFPAPLDDVVAALRWMQDEADALGIRPDRIAVGGLSAGGGLAAGACLRLRAEPHRMPAFQLLIYPMLDDRTVLRTDVDTTRLRLWMPESNRLGWTSYLGRPPGSAGVPDEAAPARAADLRGLPPAWIGVGTHDLFHDEDTTYAARLREAGVPCTLEVVPGAFHGFEFVAPRAPVVARFLQGQVDALRMALVEGSAAPR